MENIFTKPERPFLLLSEDNEGNVSYSWLKTEDELQEVVSELKGYGEKIIDAIEIGSCRTIEVAPDYLVDDFIKEINSAYETAKEQGVDSITLAIDTDVDITYYINETENGFQCDEFDFYWNDLDSASAALFNEKMIGKPAEIRIMQKTTRW